MESYITDLQSREIIILAKFRCRYNHLPISSYIDVKLCTLCFKKDIGDEYFDNERKTSIDSRYIKHRTKMKCRNGKNLGNLIAFIDIIMQKLKP